MTRSNISEIELQIMWNRLLSVVEEQAQTLVRTAFSTSSREAGDISAGVFDLDGRMLAQAVTGTPGHINTMARSVGHFLEVFPVAQMREGDVYVTNDPWKGTGHLYDLVVVSPTFMDGRIVALFASTAHLVDMGGVGQTPEGRQIWHEGLFIPLLRLARAGEMNEDLLAMIRANVREPVQVIGDVYALIACNEIGSRRLVAMMREFELRDLDQLGDEIIRRSRRAMTEAIGKLPKGSWTVVDARRRLRVADRHRRHADDRARYDPCRFHRHVGHVVVRDQLPDVLHRGVYDVRRELRGGAAHAEQRRHPGRGEGDRAAGHHSVSANIPPRSMRARRWGTCCPTWSMAVSIRRFPGRVPAEGTSNLWSLKLIAGHGLTGVGGKAGTPFMMMSFHSGGAGARPHQDGLSRDAVSLRCAQRSGRGDRGDHASGDLAQGTPPGFRRRRPPARRTGPGDGSRLAGRRGVRHLCARSSG